jgi:hypothetical protein
MDANEQDVRFKRAKQRVEELKGFYAHLVVYAIINTGLLLINLATEGSSWWFYWPLVGWGVGLAIHAVMVFVIEGPRGHVWEERKIRELMERDTGGGKA